MLGKAQGEHQGDRGQADEDGWVQTCGPHALYPERKERVRRERRETEEAERHSTGLAAVSFSFCVRCVGWVYGVGAALFFEHDARFCLCLPLWTLDVVV